jgi:hypothetical protein
MAASRRPFCFVEQRIRSKRQHFIAPCPNVSLLGAERHALCGDQSHWSTVASRGAHREGHHDLCRIDQKSQEPGNIGRKSRESA